MPAPVTLPGCSVLLLAGGRGQRMGGADKGLLDWQGRPLIAWLHERVRPLTDDLIISCNRNAERYAAYADRLVSDAESDFPGPLAGILAGLDAARHDWLLVLPCDAPLIDHALLQALRETAEGNPATPVMVSSPKPRPATRQPRLPRRSGSSVLTLTRQTWVTTLQKTVRRPTSR